MEIFDYIFNTVSYFTFILIIIFIMLVIILVFSIDYYEIIQAIINSVHEGADCDKKKLLNYFNKLFKISKRTSNEKMYEIYLKASKDTDFDFDSLLSADLKNDYNGIMYTLFDKAYKLHFEPAYGRIDMSYMFKVYDLAMQYAKDYAKGNKILLNQLNCGIQASFVGSINSVLIELSNIAKYQHKLATANRLYINEAIKERNIPIIIHKKHAYLMIPENAENEFFKIELSKKVSGKCAVLLNECYEVYESLKDLPDIQKNNAILWETLDVISNNYDKLKEKEIRYFEKRTIPNLEKALVEYKVNGSYSKLSDSINAIRLLMYHLILRENKKNANIKIIKFNGNEMYAKRI